MPALDMASVKLPSVKKRKTVVAKAAAKPAKPSEPAEPANKANKDSNEFDDIKYYSSLAMLLHTWRLHARQIYDIWIELYGEAEAYHACA